jgi:hypothetical protein
LRENLDFSLLGRAFRAESVSRPVAAWIRQHWAVAGHELPKHAHDISLQSLRLPPDRLSGGAVHARLHGGSTIEWRGDANEWWTGDDRAGVRLAVDRSTSEIQLWDDRAPNDNASRDDTMYAALYLALCESLRASGLLPLHASVIVREGVATALCGPSGIGKSTTLLRAIDAGWTPLAEDLSWLEPASLDLHGWDRGVRLWPEGRARLAGWREASWDTDADGKLFIPYERLGTDLARRAPLRRMLVLSRDDTRASAVEALASHDMVRVLWESIGVPLTQLGRDVASRAIATLIARVEVARLVIGRGSPAL